MKSARQLPTIALALLLSGCFWQGPAFYHGDPSIAGPVAAGRYKMDILGDHKPASPMIVTRLGDGSFFFDEAKPTTNDHGEHLVFAPLAMAGRNLWIVQITNGFASSRPPGSADDVTYGLVEWHGDVLEMNQAIPCEGSEAIVRAAGGIVTERSEPDADGTPDHPREANTVCRFTDRAALERALVAYAGLHTAFPIRVRLKRIADR